MLSGGAFSEFEVDIQEGVASIGASVFTRCTINSFKSFKIPSSMSYFSKDAFKNCDNLKDLYYSGTKEEWNAIIGVNDAGLPDDCTIHGDDGATWKYKE